MSEDYAAKIKQLEAAQKRAETISGINAALSYADDEQAILAAIGPFVEQFGVELYSISYAEDIQPDGKPKTLVTVALRNGAGEPIPLDSLPQVRFPLAQFPLNALAFDTPDQPLFIEDGMNDPRTENGETRAILTALGLQAFIMLPLQNSSQVRGLISFNWSQPQTFSDEMRDILTAIQPTLAAVVASRQAQLQILEQEKSNRDALEKVVEERTAALQSEMKRNAELQQEVIEAQKQALLELSTPIIPIMDRIIIMPIIGIVDTQRARDITRALLKGIGDYRAQIIIVDVTGVPLVDTGVADHLNRTIQAARLKGAHTIVTGISDAVAETIVDLGIDWSDIDTLRDMQTGLVVALRRQGIKLIKQR